MNKANERIAKLLNENDKSIEKAIISYEKEIISAYEEALKKIKSAIAAMYEKYGDDLTYSKMMQYNRLVNLEKQITEEIKQLTNKNIATTKSAIKDIFTMSFAGSADAVAEGMSINLNFGQLSKEQIDAVILNPYDRIKWTDRMKQHAQLYVNQIKNEIAQGLIQGHGYGKISKAITERTGIHAGKIARIVRTEAHRAQSAGRIIAFEKSEKAAERLGYQTKRIWVATHDERTRRSHRAMDGKPAKEIDGKYMWVFPSGVKTFGPGLSGVAEEDINCRCTTRLEVD